MLFPFVPKRNFPFPMVFPSPTLFPFPTSFHFGAREVRIIGAAGTQCEYGPDTKANDQLQDSDTVKNSVMYIY